MPAPMRCWRGVGEYVSARTSNSVTSVGALYAEDAVPSDSIFGTAAQGRAAIEKLTEARFRQESIDSVVGSPPDGHPLLQPCRPRVCRA